MNDNLHKNQISHLNDISKEKRSTQTRKTASLDEKRIRKISCIFYNTGVISELETSKKQILKTYFWVLSFFSKISILYIFGGCTFYVCLK